MSSRGTRSSRGLRKRLRQQKPAVGVGASSLPDTGRERTASVFQDMHCLAHVGSAAGTHVHWPATFCSQAANMQLLEAAHIHSNETARRGRQAEAIELT
jgi:hypothetical protein